MLESISSSFTIYKSLVEVLEENDIELTPGLRCAIVTTYSGILDFFQKTVRVFYKREGSEFEQSKMARSFWQLPKLTAL